MMVESSDRSLSSVTVVMVRDSDSSDILIPNQSAAVMVSSGDHVTE